MARIRTVSSINIFFLTLVCIIQSCNSKNEEPRLKKDAAVVVDVLVAQGQKGENKIEANGTVLANESVQLHPEVTGRLIYLNIPEGKHVTKGTVLARINDADLQAQLEKSKVLLELYEKTEQRLKTLLAVNGVNQADYDAALNNVNSTKADIAYTQALIDKTIIKAPFDGVVGLRQVSPGAFVSTNDVIASMQELNKVKIDFTLPEEYGNAIKVGNSVDVQLDALGNKKVKAIIVATEPQINQSSRNLTVRATLPGSEINVGSFVRVSVDAGVDNNAILIPTNSLIPEDKNNQVVLVKNGKAAFVNVQAGMRFANNVEITKGINAGDSVVVTGVLFAKPNGILKVRSTKTLQQFAASNNDNTY